MKKLTPPLPPKQISFVAKNKTHEVRFIHHVVLLVCGLCVQLVVSLPRPVTSACPSSRGLQVDWVAQSSRNVYSVIKYTDLLYGL